VELRDGRQLKAPVTVDAPRPQITLLSKGIAGGRYRDALSGAPGKSGRRACRGRFVFFLRSNVPVKFPRNEKGRGGRGRWQLPHRAFAGRWKPDARGREDRGGKRRSAGPVWLSAFGPIEARAISAADVTGDWLPLGTLVRLPGFKHCVVRAQHRKDLRADRNEPLPGHVDCGHE